MAMSHFILTYTQVSKAGIIYRTQLSWSEQFPVTILIFMVSSFSEFLNASYNILLTIFCWTLQIHSPSFPILFHQAVCPGFLRSLASSHFSGLVKTEIRIYIPWALSHIVVESGCAPLHKAINSYQKRFFYSDSHGLLPVLVMASCPPQFKE